MMETKKYKDLMLRIVDRVVDGHDKDWAMDIEHFDWVPGVGLYGIFQVWIETNERKYLEFLEKWMAQHLAEAYIQKTVNSTAPLLTAVHLYEKNGNEEYLKVCKDIAAFILTEAPLTLEGGLEHTVTENKDGTGGFREQIWADTLFMVCIFMAKLGMVTQEKQYTDFALRQMEMHHRLLKNSENGLYYHAWNGAEKNHMSAVCWGRANAWILYSTAEIMKITGTAEIYSDLLKTHAQSLKKYQRKNGAFGTIIDDADSYDEISATAGIAAGLLGAKQLGVLDSEFDEEIIKALDAVAVSVDGNGEVAGVSTGTPVMENAQAYKNIAVCPTLYGQGLSALAFSKLR